MKHIKSRSGFIYFFKEYKNRYFNENSQLGADAKLMLINWENNDPATIALWKK